MKLHELRLERGLSIAQLSELSGVKARTIEEVERRNKCNMDTAKKLAKALGVSLDELCYDDDEKE
jgi:transcriptional regulator with XRE-family HTH domain